MTYQRNIESLENCFYERLPDGVHQPQEASGDHDEPQRDRRALTGLPPVRPLDPLELVDAVDEESESKKSESDREK
jgi:hypothetical protein